MLSPEFFFFFQYTQLKFMITGPECYSFILLFASKETCSALFFKLNSIITAQNRAEMQTLFTNTKYNQFSGPPSVVQFSIWNKEWMLQLVPSLLLVHCYAMGINLSMTLTYALKQDQLCMITLCPPASRMRALLDTSLVVCACNATFIHAFSHILDVTVISLLEMTSTIPLSLIAQQEKREALSQHLKTNLLVEFLYQFNFSFLHPRPTLRD